ncbi:MAG: 3-keto-5-aminohexanoate cleavage protein [Deltaproteobacteria bacterium]|nr:3-keto-5-aminohexanoate cleavage protein [Deltaproteobacteria bacterium]
MQPLVITAAICGAEVFRDQSPYVPYSPAELADEAVRCFEAGASMVHLHVREPDGTPSQRADLFADAMGDIRARCPMIVQFSTGGAVGMGVDERADAVRLRPDMATLSTGSVNFGDDVFSNPLPLVRQIARRVRQFGVVPEIECFDSGMVDTALRLARDGEIALPAHFDFVLGMAGGMGGSERHLDFMRSLLPEGSSWSVAGIGRCELPLARHAIAIGGHVRVGLEDNLYLSKGVLAKGSFELVAAVAHMARDFGRPLATSDQAREILRLPPRSLA